jgi:hypothetical protein
MTRIVLLVTLLLLSFTVVRPQDDLSSTPDGKLVEKGIAIRDWRPLVESNGDQMDDYYSIRRNGTSANWLYYSSTDLLRGEDYTKVWVKWKIADPDRFPQYPDGLGEMRARAIVICRYQQIRYAMAIPYDRNGRRYSGRATPIPKTFQAKTDDIADILLKTFCEGDRPAKPKPALKPQEKP